MKKTQPVVDVDSKHREQEAEFEKKWGQGELDNDKNGDHSAKRAADAAENEGIWCSACAQTVLFQKIPFVLNTNGQVKRATRSKQFMTHISNPKGISKRSKSRLHPTSPLRTPMAPPTTQQMARQPTEIPPRAQLD